MISNWGKYRLDEIANISMGQSPKSIFYNEDGNGLPFFQGKTEFSEYHPLVRQFTSKTIKKAYKDDVLFTVRAPVGELNVADQDCCIGRGLAAIQAKDKNENKFLYYILKAHKRLFLSRSSGAVYDAINGVDLKSSEIFIPHESRERIKIAKILSNYDDLIENNLKRINLLEESARLTYDELFLRFIIDGKKLDIDPDSGLPFGWKKIKVNSLISYYIGGGWGEESASDDFCNEAYVVRGTDIDNIPYGKIESVPFRYHKNSNLASRKLLNKDIIFEVSGGSKIEGVAKSLIVTNGLLDQFQKDLICASFCKLVRPKEQYLGNFLFLSFKYLRNSKASEVFEIRGASSIVNYNWEAFIKYQDLIMPNKEVLLKFDYEIDVIINQIYNLGHQNQLLKEARDILLPRLMTGMINADELDVAV